MAKLALKRITKAKVALGVVRKIKGLGFYWQRPVSSGQPPVTSTGN